MTKTDSIYISLLQTIFSTGETLPGRNGDFRRCFTLPNTVFESTPLVTLRTTAWKKAIREMEWFLSGDPTCPTELLDWWAGQLNIHNSYRKGYGEQLRAFNGCCDQISNLLEGMREHPFSRRHIITTWHPIDMLYIVHANNNLSTPTTCHTTIAQFFISSAGMVSMHSYQRSADMLLGVPHNWIQSWALLLWVAAQVEGVADKMVWTFGDAHIYMEESHVSVARQLTACKDSRLTSSPPPRLHYTGRAGDEFKTTDFEMIGDIPSPVTTARPKLL